MTNADRIRAMDDEELVNFLSKAHRNPCDCCCSNLQRCLRNNALEPVCERHWLEWMREEM